MTAGPRAPLLAIVGLVSALIVNESRAQSLTTVCDLTRFPHRYASHRVEISGQVIGGVEFLLRDQSCSHRAIGIVLSNFRESDVAALLSAMREGYIGKVDKQITATLVGTYHYRRGQHPAGVLFVEHVRDLKVKLDKPSQP